MTAERPAPLVVGLSARALVDAAARAGYRPIAVDYFADLDTVAAARHAERYPGAWTCGFQRGRLIPAIERAIAAAGVDPIGIVLGSGFEDRPRLIATLASRWPLLGCGPEAVRAVKSPERFATTCVRLGIPHPRITTVVPPTGDFLLRRRAGTGGNHIRPADPGPVPAGHIAQARMPGTPISAAVLSTGREARVVAWTAQWPAPTAEAPFRFAGVGGPVDPPAAFATAMDRAATALALAFGLVGLVSVDALAGPDSWWILEINPRPGGSLDVLDHGDQPLLGAHVAACQGVLSVPRIDRATIRVTEVVHAPVDSALGDAVIWPAWVHDRPPAGTRFRAGDPVATVAAAGPDLADARGLARRRGQALVDQLRDWGHHG